MDAAEIVAAQAVAWTFKDLDQAAIDAARRGILDTVGVALAATGIAPDEAAPFADLALDWGGRPEATLLGTVEKVPAPAAAFAFGALAHVMDYDDIVDVAQAHPSAPVVAAALPLAEAVGDVSGAELLTAVALGQDLAIRLNMALDGPATEQGWLPSTVGVFGATLTATKLLRLTVEQTTNALGLALHQAGGTRQCGIGMGSSFRAVRDGFSARNAVTSALLAARGVRGDRQAFEGTYGLLQVHFRGGYDRRRLLEGLGTRLRGELIGHKRWPSCAYSHFFIAPLQQLMADHAFGADDVSKIVVVGEDETHIRSQCEPREARCRPAHAIDAKTSLPFQLGKVLTSGTLVLDDFTAEGLIDVPAIRAAEKVEWRVGDFADRRSRVGAGMIEVDLVDGRHLVAGVDHAPGSAADPMTWDQLVAKFRECVAHASRPPSKEATAAFVCRIGALEGDAAAASLLNVLAPT